MAKASRSAAGAGSAGAWEEAVRRQLEESSRTIATVSEQAGLVAEMGGVLVAACRRGNRVLTGGPEQPVGMDRALARTWQHEIAHLYRACEIVHHPG
jgi:hypothetical protein